MTTQLRINQVTLVNGIAHDFNYHRTMQLGIGVYNLNLRPIHNFYGMEYIEPVDDYAGKFYYLMFDYETKYHPWAVSKISEQVKTTAFDNSYSLN